MRKQVVLIAVLASLALLAGCSSAAVDVGGNQSTTTTTSKKSTTTTTFNDDFYKEDPDAAGFYEPEYSEPTYLNGEMEGELSSDYEDNSSSGSSVKYLAVGKEKTIGKIKIKVNGVRYADNYKEFCSGSGEKFIVVSVNAYTDDIPRDKEYHEVHEVVSKIRLTNGQYIGEFFTAGTESKIIPAKQQTINIIYTVSNDKYIEAVVLSDETLVLIDDNAVKSEKPKKTTTTTTAKHNKTQYKIGEYFKFDGLEMVLDYGIQFKTIENRYSEYNGETVIAIPTSVKNISGKTHGLNTYTYRHFGPDGTQTPTSISVYFQDSVDDIGDMRNGAIDYGYMYILYEGDGDYIVEFNNYTERIEVTIPVKK